MGLSIIALDAKTRVITEELPYKDCSFTHVLNGKGEFDISLPLSHKVGLFEKLSDSTLSACRTIVMFIRDGVPLFGGFVTQEDVQISEDDESFRISGPEIVVGYLSRLELFTTYKPVGVEQFLIVQQLDNYAFDQVGITVAYDAFSGVTRQRTWFAQDRNNIMKEIDDMSAVIDGFDYCPEYSGSQAAGFTLKLRLGYPELRRATGGVIDLQKNVKTLNLSRDGSRMSSFYSVRGKTAGEKGVVTHAYSVLNTLYPEQDSSEASDTDDLNLLFKKAQQGLKTTQFPSQAVRVSVDPADPDVAPGSFRVGDEMRVIAKRGRVNIDDVYRVRSWTLQATEDGDESLAMEMTPADQTS